MLNKTTVTLILCECQVETNLDFSKERDYWATFLVLDNYFYIFFGEISQVLSPSLIGLFGFGVEFSSLNILDINLISNIWFASIFSHSIGCLFIVLMFSFAVKKLLRLIIPIFAFTDFAFSVTTKIPLPRPIQGASSLCFLLGVPQD